MCDLGGVVWCGVVWCGVVWCGVVWCVCVCVWGGRVDGGGPNQRQQQQQCEAGACLPACPHRPAAPAPKRSRALQERSRHRSHAAPPAGGTGPVGDHAAQAGAAPAPAWAVGSARCDASLSSPFACNPPFQQVAAGKNQLYELGPGQQIKAMTKRIDAGAWGAFKNMAA